MYMKFIYSVLLLALVVAESRAATFIKGPALYENTTSTVSSAGVTPLLNTSETIQVLTGSASHVFKLPDATTLGTTVDQRGRRFEFANRSSGTLSIQNFDGSAFGLVRPGEDKVVRNLSIATQNGSWDISFNGYVRLTGDTMTGTLNIAPPSGNAELVLDAITADDPVIRLRKGGVDKGGMVFEESTPELYLNTMVGRIDFRPSNLSVFSLYDTDVRATVPFRGGSGAVGAPTYSFSADPTLGIYRVTSGILGFAVGGVERARLISDGLRLGTTGTGTYTRERFSNVLMDAGAAETATAGNSILYQTTNGAVSASQYGFQARYRRTITTTQTDTVGAAALRTDLVFDVPSGQTLNNTSSDGIFNLYVHDAIPTGTGAISIFNYGGVYIEPSATNVGTNKFGLRIGNQSGSTNNMAIDTGTGLVRFGDEVRFKGSTSGYVGFRSPAAPTSYSLVWPSAQGGATTCLVNDGAGNLSWGTCGGGGGGGFADGTFSAPSIYFTADPDTGLFRVGSDQIGVSLGGNRHLYLGKAAAAGTSLQLRNSGADGAYLMTDAADSFLSMVPNNTISGSSFLRIFGPTGSIPNVTQFFTAGNEAARITAGGAWLLGLTSDPTGGSFRVVAKETSAGNARVMDLIGSQTATAASGTAPTLMIQNTDSTVGNYSSIAFAGANGIGDAYIYAKHTDHVNGYGLFDFITRDSTGFASRFRLQATGPVVSGGLAMRLENSIGNYVGLKAPAILTSYELTLPAAPPAVNGQVMTFTTAGVGTWSNPGGGVAPTVTKYTSGSGTYNTPAGVLYLRVRMVGGGGGGQGSGLATGGGNGGAGGNTTLASVLTAAGGSGGVLAGGAGGAPTINSPAYGTGLTGGSGGLYASFAGSGSYRGGDGGVNPLGGEAKAGVQTNGLGQPGVPNTGAGGAGSASNLSGTNNGVSGGGGGAGAYIDAIIPTPLSSYSYSVGASGSAGSAGPSGAAGSLGGSGYIEITEFYQ
jgi:hypothetical protein